MWSARLVQSLKALGHAAEVVTSIPEGDADAAIVNLSSPTFVSFVPLLKERGVHTIGHAGHKEKDLLKLGAEAGCDKVATNSELTYKIAALLDF